MTLPPEQFLLCDCSLSFLCKAHTCMYHKDARPIIFSTMSGDKWLVSRPRFWSCMLMFLHSISHAYIVKVQVKSEKPSE